MKRFILSICIGIALTTIPIGFLLGYRWVVLNKKADTLFATKSGQHILVMGDSHSERAFVETNGIKMLTYHSTPMNVSLMRLKELERRGGLSPIKVCILNFCYTSTSQWGYKGQIESTWRLLPISLQYLDLIPIPRKKLYVKLFEMITANLDEMPPIASDATKRSLEIPLNERSEEWSEKSATAALKRHFAWGEQNPEAFIPTAFEHLDETIRALKEICDAHSIRLVFFSAPLHKKYLDGVPEWGHKNLEHWVKRVQNLGGIDYYNFMQWGSEEDFCDPDHLNKRGAEKFTQMFYAELVKSKVFKP